MSLPNTTKLIIVTKEKNLVKIDAQNWKDYYTHFHMFQTTLRYKNKYLNEL